MAPQKPVMDALIVLRALFPLDKFTNRPEIRAGNN
jgi:hypothetical protein